MIYRAQYNNGEFEIIYAHTDNKAIEKAKEHETEHGILLVLDEVKDDECFSEIRNIPLDTLEESKLYYVEADTFTARPIQFLVAKSEEEAVDIFYHMYDREFAKKDIDATEITVDGYEIQLIKK